jgi:hypothetical protein|eukprot:COSAG01_NODE_4079_length_5376_cov_433.496494_2_plen_51_part_00
MAQQRASQAMIGDLRSQMNELVDRGGPNTQRPTQRPKPPRLTHEKHAPPN